MSNSVSEGASSWARPVGGGLVLLGLMLATTTIVSAGSLDRASASEPACPAEMAHVRSFCIDRWEVMTIDKATGQALSPYYPPHAGRLRQVNRLWQIERLQVGDVRARAFPLPPIPPIERTGRFEPQAVSRPGVVPQGYLSHALAARACENAGKRLCSEAEWVTACRGPLARKFPYGNQFDHEACNVYRYFHPAYVLHGVSFVGHTDPRLNLVVERGEDPLLHLTGATERCQTDWAGEAIYDMVGNLDEWIDDPAGTFVGGFYARSTREGCEAKITSHSPEYYDYSLGTRCCRDAR